MGDEGCKLLLENLSCTKLKTLSFGSKKVIKIENSLTQASIQEIVAIIPIIPELEDLWLFCNEFTEAGFEILAKNIQKLKSLKSIHLYGTK